MQNFQEYIKKFGRINDDIIVGLKTNFKKIHLSKKEKFASDGEYARKIGFLETGIIRSFIRSSEGNEYTKQFFIAPSFVGAYSSLITKQPNRIIQQALTDCTIWVADYSSIEALYEQYHELESMGRKIAEYYYLEKEQSIIEMALYDAKKRYLLLRSRFPNLEKQVQQSFIASYLGVFPTQLSRIRKKIKDS